MRIRRRVLLWAFACGALCGAAWAGPGRDPRSMGLLPQPAGDLWGHAQPGAAPALPGQGELAIQVVRVADCRNVRAFVINPADGRMDSWNYSQWVQEYDSPGWTSRHWELPTYEYVKNPGVHMTLADDAGFNYLSLRGGFEGSVYVDVDTLEGPGQGRRILDVAESAGPDGPDHFRVSRHAFEPAVKARRVSFFKKGKLLADAAFMRVGAAALPEAHTGSLDFAIGGQLAESADLGPDFTQWPAKPEDRRPSTFRRRFFREQDRTLRALTPGQGQALSLRPGEAVHLLTPPLKGGFPLGALRLALDAGRPAPGNVFTVAAQDPLEGSREIARVDLRMGANPRIECLLDFPDQIVAEGRRFWVTLISRDGLELGASSRLRLMTKDPAKALAEYVDYRLYLVKGLFSLLAEARPWERYPAMNYAWLKAYDGSDWNVEKRRFLLLELYASVEQLHALAPEHPAVRAYHNWLARGRESGASDAIPAIAPIPGAPRWAQLMDRAAQKTIAIPEWWIAHRQAPNGEFGCFLGDDTDFVQWWTPLVMLDPDGFGVKARWTFKALAALLLEHNLRDGVSRMKTDPLHSYEEGVNHMSVAPLLFHGDPRYVEWLMLSARTAQGWMMDAPGGALAFRVAEFGHATATQPPAAPADKASPAADLMLHPHTVLAWYNGDARAREVLRRYAQSQGGYVEGAYGEGLGISFANYWFTGDVRYVGLPGPDAAPAAYARWGRKQGLLPAKVREAREMPWWPAYQRMMTGQVMRPCWAVSANQDRKLIERCLEHILWGNPTALGGGLERFLYIWTEAEIINDRVFLPTDFLGQAMLGGYTARNRLWPAYAVSYDGFGGGGFAALVLDQGRDRLKACMVNLRDSPRTGGVRVWMLDHGRYKMEIGPDANDDGEFDAVPQTCEVELARMSRLSVTLPPRQVTLLRLTQAAKLDDLLSRPDLAVSEDDLTREGDAWRVTVHNIGAKPAGRFRVALVDGEGRVLSRSEAAGLDAPLDWRPRTVTLKLPAAAGAERAVVDPDNAVAEITEDNNRLTLP
ncbi:MAG TPA: CARDB domain-containing protein [Candidatus Brocadiia bacterium]|nr:CARDB domain-containing protein [Candidatus Brocadiia bacterium]